MAQYRKDTFSYMSDSKTIFEAVMLADQYGNIVGAANPSGMAVDAFGRARSSQPFTLFDSFHRYQDNGKITTANSATGTFTHNSNSSTVSMTVDTTSGAYVKRESSRVFAYQPGKSLQILQTYVLNPAKTNLRQRFGYFNDLNGVFLQLNNSELSFIVRSNSTSSVVENKVVQADWNIDKLDGTGPSGLTLDITKAQIQFIDIEWLGLGTVRVGFVINGRFIHCHSFHHANLITNTYMTTGCLPVRAEIENTGITSSSSTLQIVCTSVISEGGYEIRGKTRTYGIEPAPGFAMATAGTYYPVISIRINPNKPDSIVIPKEIDLLPISAANYRWKIISGATFTGDTWANVATDSSVQYQSNNAATFTGGTELISGYATSTVQGGGSINITDNNIFQYQLERNSFANTFYTFTLAVTSGTASSNVAGSITWMEIT